MDAPASYFHWGVILISIPNLLLIIGMVILFLVAAVARVGSHDNEDL